VPCSRDACLRQVLLTGPTGAQTIVWGSLATILLSQILLSPNHHKPKSHKPKGAHSPEWKGRLGHAYSCCEALALQPGCSPWASAANRPCCACSSRLWLVHNQLLSQYALIHMLQILNGQYRLIGPLFVLQTVDENLAISPLLRDDEGYIHCSRLGIPH